MHPLDNEALKLGARAVRRRRLDAENRQDLISLLGRVVVILLCAWVLFTQVFLLTQAKGSSMFPAVKDGDLLICYRLQKTYAKNDVVVYTQGGKLRVGRILGREGDLVALDDSGTLVVNGAVQSGEILYPTYAKDALEYPYTVPEGCFFVLGDYRTQSARPAALAPSIIPSPAITFTPCASAPVQTPAAPTMKPCTICAFPWCGTTTSWWPGWPCTHRPT